MDDDATADRLVPSVAGLRFHHVAVQTADMDVSTEWYQKFFDAEITWTLDTFSQLSMERLPGLSRVTELKAGELRFHLFSRNLLTALPPNPDTNQFQHVCLEVSSPEELRNWRVRWMSIFDSGQFCFAGGTPATEIVTDSDGVQSFYAVDVNGVEFEFTCLP
jgi:catechol 2,3-dioxygenase-like lactoylglutathione lyase family enzyme